MHQNDQRKARIIFSPLPEGPVWDLSWEPASPLSPPGSHYGVRIVQSNQQPPMLLGLHPPSALQISRCTNWILNQMRQHGASDVSELRWADAGPRAPSLSIPCGLMLVIAAFALLLGVLLVYSHGPFNGFPQTASLYTTAAQPSAVTTPSHSLFHRQTSSGRSSPVPLRRPVVAGAKTRPRVLHAVDGYLMGSPQTWSPTMPPAELGPETRDTANVLIAAMVVGLVLVGYRTVVYFQLRYITAALIANHVPMSATCLELGIGSGRNLYYYPKGVKKIFGVDSDSNPKLLQTSAELCLQTVELIPSPVAAADAWSKRLATASVDCVISTKTGGASADVLEEIARVLRPGGKLLFVESAAGGGNRLLLAIANSPGFLKPEVDDGWLAGPLNKTVIGMSIRAGGPSETEQPIEGQT